MNMYMSIHINCAFTAWHETVYLRVCTHVSIVYISLDFPHVYMYSVNLNDSFSFLPLVVQGRCTCTSFPVSAAIPWSVTVSTPEGRPCTLLSLSPSPSLSLTLSLSLPLSLSLSLTHLHLPWTIESTPVHGYKPQCSFSCAA